MKQINAQWAFLIILALWIPVLCFADEVAEQEQTIVVEVEETIVVSDFVGPPYEPEEMTLIFHIWAIGVSIFLAIGAILILSTGLYMLYTSLRFNYNLYITHGEFAWWFGDGGSGEDKRRKEIATEMKLNPDETDQFAWWCVWVFIGIAIISVILFSFLWPIALVALAPFFIIRTIGHKKRRKKVFQDKLKGNETNGLV